MTLQEFIKENRLIIDQIIKAQIPEADITDEDREDWVSNHEGLYLEAQDQGMEI